MDYRTIVLIFNTPALETDIATYSLQEILDLGYELIVLDASPILLPVANRMIAAKRIGKEKIHSFICQTYKELENYIKKYADTACFIPMFNCYYDVRKVFSLFTKYNVFYGHVTTARTELELSDIGYTRPTKKNSRLNPCHVYKALYNRIGRKVFNKKADFVVLGGRKHSESLINATLHDKDTKILRLHTWDYERFLNTEKYDNNGKPYCVYLDQYLPFHPDLVTELGLNIADGDKQRFVTDMNAVFNRIKTDYNMDVIIAAHPRADYKDKPTLYPNSKIEYGATSQLVKGASLVVANFSNSIMFAVMANIPVILVNSEIIEKNDYLRKMQVGFSDLIGASIIKSAKQLPNNMDFSINKEKYDAVRKMFIQSNDTNGMPMWQIILETI